MTNQNARPVDFETLIAQSAADPFGAPTETEEEFERRVNSPEHRAEAEFFLTLTPADAVPGRAVSLEEFFADADAQETARFNSATEDARVRIDNAIGKLEEALQLLFAVEETDQATGILTPGEGKKVRDIERQVFAGQNILKGIRANITRPVPSGIDGSDVRREDSKPGQREEQF